MEYNKVVVTGAGGFLGQYVLTQFNKVGLSIRALCGQPHELPTVEPLCDQAVVGDILDQQVVEHLVEGCDAVVHLAGPPFVHESFQRPLQYAKVHVLGTIAVVQACLKFGIHRLVYISSAEVYGPGGSEDVHEDQPLRPQSPYGLAKVSAEQFIANLFAGSEVSSIVLRPFAVYGRGGHEAALIPTIVRQIRTGARIELNNLQPIRDYCHVQDVARAVELGLRCKSSGVEMVNIGSGQGHSVEQLARKALEVANRELPVLQRSSSDRPLLRDVDRLVASIDRARTLLGWQPRISLELGLKELLNERIIEPSSQE